MPTLNWIGKDKIINHHLDVPYRVLEHQYGFTEKGEQSERTDSGNMIIHGDNLEALKALLPEYEGRVKCIYIDPPYNTGNESWVYNDNVNDPKIAKWLQTVVGKEGEDLSRHDKWLCMMYPRLKLLHRFLSEQGIIIIHIDENAYTLLHLLLIEIFGRNNELGTLIWDKKNPKGDANKISYQHESILLFAKNHQNVKEDLIRKKKNALSILSKAEQLFSKIGKTQYPENLKEIVKQYDLPKSILEQNASIATLESINQEFRAWIKKQDFTGGETAYNTIDQYGNVFQSVSMAWPNKKKAPEDYFIPLIHPVTKKPCTVPDKGWRFPSKSMEELLQKDEILFGIDETTQPRRKYILKNNLYENISSIIRFGGSDDKFQAEIGIKLENPKPFHFANEILGYFTKEKDIVLDSFAGSGTTAHAVLNLNREDGQNRRFILIEMMEYAENITAERIKRIIKGYGEIEGTKGSFDFYTIGQKLFDQEERLNEEIDSQHIRQYVYYSETKSALKLYNDSAHPYFLGLYNDTAYYFYYKRGQITTLNHEFLSTIKTKAEQYVIYADNCTLGKDFLIQYHIIFKKISRDIARV
jgi:adenine-specific DNA-methyltransferase